jgi:xanthine dehydrogenase YagS FAD-binding subunit
MKSFEYANPTDLDTAIGLLDGGFGETEILAGGTDLVTSLKQGLVAPKRLVNLKGIASLKGIEASGDTSRLKGLEASGDTIRIGATTPLIDVFEHERIKKEFPAIIQAIEGIGSPQIINMGTIAGDLCQRPRCWYYRQGFGLLGELGGKSLIPDGDNRYHAIFGNEGPAYFVNPSVLAPPLIVLGATLDIVGPNSKSRQVPVVEFFRIPKTASERENVLAANEVITRISIPVRGLSNATYEVRQRQGLDWPLVAAAVAFGGKADDKPQIVLGHVAPKPWAVPDAAALLSGKAPDSTLAARVGEAAAKGAKPLSKNAYKVQLVKTAVKRAILAAADKAKG